MRYVYLLFYLFLSVQCFSQKSIDWTLLADVTFEEEFDADLGMGHEKATFGDQVVEYDSVEVPIKGYVIPLDAMGFSYALSLFPNAACFFCGNAGPETVLYLRLKPQVLREMKFQMDEQRTFKGMLKLNQSNANQFTYELLQAEPI